MENFVEIFEFKENSAKVVRSRDFGRLRLRLRNPDPAVHCTVDVEVAFIIVFKFLYASKQILSIGKFAQPRLVKFCKGKYKYKKKICFRFARFSVPVFFQFFYTFLLGWIRSSNGLQISIPAPLKKCRLRPASINVHRLASPALNLPNC